MTNQAMVPRAHTALATEFNGTMSEPSRVTAALQKASQEYHLVSPATSCGTLPEGCEVALSTVLVDVTSEVYRTGGGYGDLKPTDKVGLSKVALDRISIAAGISWDPDRSRRLDDGRDPHYCMYCAVGIYRHFDGRECIIQGTKEMDLRRDSAQVESLMERYHDGLAKWKAGGERGYEPRDPTAQIREMRLHLVSHAESKARLRAIRALGIRTSYTVAELAKPFVVSRLMFTGHSHNPELRRMFAEMQARAMIAGSRALYGTEPTVHLPPALSAPPPRRALEEDDDLPELSAPHSERTVTVPPAATQAATTPATAPVAPQAGAQAPRQPVTPAPERAPGEFSGLVIPGGRSKGTPIETANVEDLRYWADRFRKTLADGTGKPQFRAKDEAQLAAFEAEIARIEGGPGGPAADDGAGSSSDDIPF